MVVLISFPVILQTVINVIMLFIEGQGGGIHQVSNQSETLSHSASTSNESCCCCCSHQQQCDEPARHCLYGEGEKVDPPKR